MPGLKIRCFISLVLPRDVKETIAAIQQKFKSGRVRGSWPGSKGFHLTLSFLGDQSLEDLPAIQNAMRTVATTVPGFQICLDRPGVFPNEKNPRVLWVGLGGELDLLQDLNRKISTALKSNGIHLKKQRFSPHITIGRIKGRGSAPLIKDISLKIEPPKACNFHVDGIHLYESRLTPKGAIHTQIYTAALTGSGYEVAGGGV